MKRIDKPIMMWAILVLIFMLGGWIVLHAGITSPINAYGFNLFASSSAKAPQQSFNVDPVFEKHSISLFSDSSLSPIEVHAGGLEVLGQESLFAVWYGGSREGARDVKLYKSTYVAGKWSEPAAFMTPEILAQHTGRAIKKLGNPVALKHTNGKLFVFFNSVTIGGWAGSAINVMQSTDDGQTFSPPKRLVTSPFFNISTLVRTAPFLYANGDIGLPIYHEFIGKYSELLRLSSEGVPLYKQRISHGDRALQPSVALHSSLHATKWQRNANKSEGRVLFSHTLDGGENWSLNRLTDVPNPDSGVTSLGVISSAEDAIHRHAALLVYNHSTEARYRLSLGYVDIDDQAFTRIADIEYQEDKKGRFSYPQIRKSVTSEFYDLVYTANRKTIEHVRFNQAWLDQQLEAQGLRPLARMTASSWPSKNGALQALSGEKTRDITERLRIQSVNTNLYSIPFILFVSCLVWVFMRRFEVASTLSASMKAIALVVGFVVSVLILFYVPIGRASLLEWCRGLFGGLSSASWCLLGLYVYQLFVVPSSVSRNNIASMKAGLWIFIALLGLLFYPLALGWGMFDPYHLGYTFSSYFTAFMLVLLICAFVFRKNMLVLMWLVLALILFVLLPYESVNVWDYLIDPLAVIISVCAIMKYKFKGVYTNE